MSEQTDQQNHQNQQNQQQRKPGSRRRRRRPRRRQGQGAPQGPPIEVQGYLWVRDNGSPLMVSAKHNFVAQRSDPIVPAELIQPMHLETGLVLEGKA